MNIGIIGTGAIGLPIAQNIKNKYGELSFYARNASVIQQLKTCGLIYKNKKELSETQDVILLFVNDFNQCYECLMELIQYNFSGILIIGSTIAPKEMIELDCICKKNNIQILAAPVTGGVSGAEQGALTIIVSGKYDIYLTVNKFLEMYGSKIVFMGEKIELAHSMKALVQFLVGINTIGTAEVLTLGYKAGLDLKLVKEVIKHSAGTSRIFENRCNTILNRDFHKRGTIAILNKDLDIVSQMQNNTNAILPLANICSEIFKIGNNNLNNEEDFSSIIKLYENWNNIIVNE